MTVALATLDDLRQVVADLLDASAPAVVGRGDARRILDLSDTVFGELVRDGVIRPVPHLRPRKYSVELLRRFAAGDPTAFAHLAPAVASSPAANPPVAGFDGPAGADSTAVLSGGEVLPLPASARPGQGTGGPDSDRSGDAA